MDDVKKREVAEIERIRNVLNLEKDNARCEIEDKKDLHIKHLVQTHQELFNKMKNFYNDIIKNDILLVKSLKVSNYVNYNELLCLQH